MERIGIFGGSFDPPHIGHIQAARKAAQVLNLDKLLLMPVATPPHKEARVASGQQRLDMLRIACREDAVLHPCDLELQRGGVSYTYQTLQQLREQYPDAKLYLLVGTDMFLSFDSWKQPDTILELATLAVFYRGEKDEVAKIQARKRELEQTGQTVVLIENDVVDISSTQLRRMLAFQCGEPFLPAGVGDYIRSHGLYDSTADWKCLPMEQLESIVIRLLNPNRVNHVLGCRDTAVALAKRWGVSETDAARAGILHDITKALDGPLQLTLCAEYGIVLDTFSQNYPKTLHALTGSLVAGRIFGENERVVSAICHHTTGRADMTTLEKIIYIADYVEVNRNFPGVEEMRAMACTDLDKAVLMGLESAVAHVRRQGQGLAPATLEALEFLKNRK